jgi:sec-independent protein translocase protein TatB
MVSPPPIELATLGWEDSLILMVLALVVFGPRRLPMIGRQIGKLMYEFRKASNDFKFQMEEELRAAEDADRRKKEEAERQRAAALAASSQASVSAAPQTTVEAAADVGAVEPPVTASGYPDAYPAETPASEPALTVQPPQTGEQVSASAPFSAAVAEVNPEADTDANAAGIEAQLAAAPDATSESSDTASNLHGESPNPKEPVIQHG